MSLKQRQRFTLPIPNTDPTYALAYLSNMGPIDSTEKSTLRQLAKVRTLVILIHGTLSNPDDLLCCTKQAVSMTSNVNSASVLLIAPWFLTISDPTVRLSQPQQEALLWMGTNTPWRYGADSVNGAPPISSFAVMDALLDYVWNNWSDRFGSLTRIVVAGHSAGGQYVHRWALLSPSPTNVNIPIRAVVANAMSFCFLDGRRVIDGSLQFPDTTLIETCPDYNDWEWGLGPGNHDVPYKDDAIQQAGGVVNTVARYLQRSVVYLAGGSDTLKNGNCRERLQGSDRTDRSKNFLKSLNILSGGITPIVASCCPTSLTISVSCFKAPKVDVHYSDSWFE